MSQKKGDIPETKERPKRGQGETKERFSHYADGIDNFVTIRFFYIGG
jgi:hypothetical protein